MDRRWCSSTAARARRLGLGSRTCWIGDFREEKVKHLLKIPNGWKVVALIAFGYPAEHPEPKRKKIHR